MTQPDPHSTYNYRLGHNRPLLSTHHDLEKDTISLVVNNFHFFENHQGVNSVLPLRHQDEV